MAEIILEQAVSGYSPRPALASALGRLREGDSLVVWKLDRLGRRMVETVQTVEDLSKRGIEVYPLPRILIRARLLGVLCLAC